MKNKKFFNINLIFCYERGQRLIDEEKVDGEVPYISSTKKNNGIESFVSPPDFMKVHKNRMTLSNSGSVGYLFYHDYEFVASDHVTIIWIKDQNVVLNSNIAAFLKPIFESIRYKYSFGREISNSRLSNENVLLPVTEDNNPDWEYMDDYVSQLAKKVFFPSIETINKNKSQNISVEHWKPFKIFEIFTEKRGERLIATERIPGEIDYYSASSYNNGLTDRISNPLFIENNALIIITFGDCFYVNGDFTASDEITILKNSNLNKYNGLFLSSIIRQFKYKFEFGRKAFKNKLENEKILLPVKMNNEIDWEFMENYIKSLPYSEKI